MCIASFGLKIVLVDGGGLLQEMRLGMGLSSL